MAARKQTIMRLTMEQDRMLDELAKLTQQTRNEVVTGLIVGEYDRINGNPAAKLMIEQMNQLAIQMKEFTSGTKADPAVKG